jgi:hypothetical protein
MPPFARHIQVISSAAWLPASASVSLLAWYKADAGVTQSGGLVTAWADQSGAGDANRNQAASGAPRPSFSASDAAYGGKPIVSGTGTHRMLCPGAWSTAPNPPITVVVVGETAASTAFLGDSTTDNMMYATGTPNEAVYGPVAAANAGSSNPTTPGVIMYKDTGSAATIYRNNLGSASGTFATSVWSSMTRIDLLSGYGSGFTFLTGKIAEVIVWGGVISATDKTNLVNYLNVTRAYGLGVT